MISKYFVAGLLVLNCITIASLYGQDETEKTFSDYYDVSGYVKDLGIVSFSDAENALSYNFLHNRINFRGYPGDNLTFGLDVRNRIFYGEAVKTIPDFSASIQEDAGYYFDLSALPVNNRSFVFHTIVDRAWVNWQGGKWDVTLGRQRINWGVNLVWNPNDLFNVFNYANFDYEERPGSDALRVQYYTGPMSSAEIAVKPGRNKNETVAAGFYQFNQWNYDFQFLGGLYYEDIALGTGWAGNLGNAGLKGEATYFHPKDRMKDTTGVVNASAALDYSFKSGVYVHGSMLYNSNARERVQDFIRSGLFAADLSAKNLMPTEFSYFGQVSYSFNPLFSGDFSAIYGSDLKLLFLMPSATYSIKENWDIMLLGQIFFMEQGSEYSNLGNVIFTRLKWSF